MTFKAEYYGIERETEKALLINFKAISMKSSFNTKPAWVPKSQIELLENKMIEMPYWLLSRIESDNQMTISAEKI